MLLFNNNSLRTALLPYIGCICSDEAANSLLETSAKYFSETTKSLKVTLDDLDVIFSSTYAPDSKEYLLWQDVKSTDISDIEIVESAALKYINKQIKEYFFAKSFTDDVYDLEKLDELYRLLANINSNNLQENLTEDIVLDDIDDCCKACDNSDKEKGVTFFDKRISDTLSAKQFDCGTVNVIMGAPGRGKTQLILNQSVHVAEQKQYTLHIALGDLTKRQLILRLLAMVTGNTIQQLSMLSPEQFKSFMFKAKQAHPDIFKYLVCRTCPPNVFSGMDIIKQIKDLQRAKGVKFTQIVIDYDGNLETDLSSTSKSKTKSDDSKSMYYSGADIYNSFVAFAKENGSVVWMLSQPKIQYWSVEKLPLEALSESSKKGQIVDFCMSIGKKDVTEEQCTLFISKNRHGVANVAYYTRSIGECQRFEAITNWGD